MCLIIDMCVAHRAIDPSDVDFEPVRRSFLEGKQVLVVGGQLRREYLGFSAIRSFLVELDRKGRLRIVRDAIVDDVTSQLRDGQTCESNDEHLVALARVSGARILCTSDAAAARDFTRKSLIDNPRGKVYNRRRHRHLLSRACPTRQ
jgi:hypothetical protein